MKKHLGIFLTGIICLSLIGCSADEDTEYVAVPDYTLEWDSYAAPLASAEGDEITVPKVNFLADGTMVVAEGGYCDTPLEVFVETAPGSHKFNTVGTIDNDGGCVSFILPEDAGHVLVGDNKKIYRLDLADQAVEPVLVTTSYSAKLVGDTLYVSYGTGGMGSGTAVKSVSLSGEGLAERALVTDPGYSADALIHGGFLYTAAGSGEKVGLIKCIALEDIPDGASVALADAGAEFFQAGSASSLALLGDCMLVGNSVYSADNACNVVTMDGGHEVLSFDPLADTTNDSYEVCVTPHRTALVGTDWGASPSTITVFVAPTARLIQTVRSFRP